MIKRYNKNQIKELSEILKNDGVISVPTDTVYGLCARIDSINAYNKLLKAKNRPQEKLFSIMCANEEQIKSIAKVDERAKKIIKHFMPGPITLILNKKEENPDFITNGGKTIAVRMATSKTLEELINAVGVPVFMTSANRSGEQTCSSLDEIKKSCPNIDGMLEGKIKYNQSSTIIDCTTEKIRVLREGPVAIEEIYKVI